MIEAGDERDPLDELAEEFLDRLRRGERPSLGEFVDRAPERAGELRELLSALIMVEGLKPAADETLGLVGRLVGPGAGMERLGDFRIIREIGRGGMGVVYEAEQLSLGRRVALKVVASGHARTPHQVQRFLREARSAAQLHHTNIVPVFGVGDQDGHYYYAMQFISGMGLDKVLQEVKRHKSRGEIVRGEAESLTQPGLTGTPLTSVTLSFVSGSFDPPSSAPENGRAAPDASVALPGESSLALATDSDRRYARSVARIGEQAADALEYAHKQGTLHRDIKPSNLLLDTHGTVWVADFGLAKAAEDDDLTRTGDLIGTLRYMAPERFRGICDVRSDVHALGLTLFELLALRPAFDAPDRAHLVHEITLRNPPRLRDLNPAVPRDLEMIVHKAIEREPSDRYPTAGAMAEDLRCFLEDRPIKARRVGSTEHLTRWARRNPGLAALGTVAAFLLALTVVVIAVSDLWLRREHESALKNLGRAENAEADVVAKLLESALARTRAGRGSGLAGRRFGGLEALREAAQLDVRGRLRSEFRDEAIACLALADLRPVHIWPGRTADGYVGVDFDPVSRLVARGGPRGEVWLHDVAGGREPFRLPGDGPRVGMLRFGPDGRFLAAKLDEGGRVELVAWDVKRRAEVLRVVDGVYAGAIEILPDGRTLAAGRRDGSVVFYDLTRGTELRRLSPGTVPQSIRFDRPGLRIAVVSPNSDEPVQIRNLADGSLLAGWSTPEGALSLDWSPDGHRLAVGGPDGQIHLLDADDDGRPPKVLRGHDGAVLSLAFHPGGRLLASSSWDGTLKLWDTQTLREVERAPLPDARIVRFSRDGRFLGPGHDGASSWLWELAEGVECRSLVEADGAGGRISSVDFLKDPGVLVTAGERGLRLDLTGRDATSAFYPLAGTTGAAAAPDGSFLLTGGSAGLLRWPVTRQAGGLLRVGPPESPGVLDGLPTGRLRLGPDGRTLAVVTDEELGRVVVLDIEEPGRPPIELFGHPNLERVDISPDGRWVATGTWRGTGVKVWDAARAVVWRELPVKGSADVTFSPDGRLLVTSSGTEYYVWETESWTLRHRFSRSQTGGLPGKAVFRPDGKLLALVKTRSLVQLVDPATGRELAHLEPPEPQPIGSMGFSPDGRLLTLTFDSDAIQVWDLAALRRGLAELDLDWDAPEDPLPGPGRASPPVAFVIEPASWFGPLAQSEEHARAGRWGDALSALQGAIDGGAGDINTWARRALFRLASGDEAGYREACRQLLADVEQTVPSPRTANTIAWTCAVGPASIEDYTRAIELAERAVSGHLEINRLNTLGAVLYRAGRYEEAIRQLERSASAHGAGGTPYDALFLAMAHHRIGHAEEADRWFRRATGPGPIALRKPGAVGPSSWVPRLEVELLRREATALMGSPAP